MNVSSAGATVVDYLRHTFYLLTPQETYYSDVAQVPAYVNKGAPVLLIFVILDTITSLLKGQKEKVVLLETVHNITSYTYASSFYLFIFRGAEVVFYMWMYERFRLLTLPWDSFYTYVFTFIITDFLGYVWHRVNHEIALFWAAHEQHHSSDYFNFSVAFRNSAPMRLIKWMFKVPMALMGVPPAIMIVHKELNFIFSGTYHCTHIPKLGKVIPVLGDFIEAIFMTCSNHRVHHGSNPYCIDKNFGQVFVIWDKMFGTYAEEREDEPVVYGVTVPTTSTNVAYLQVSSYASLWEKVNSMHSIGDKFRAVFYGPGWQPGTSRLGDAVVDHAKDKRIYYEKHPIWVLTYIMVNYFGLVLLFVAMVPRIKIISDWDQFIAFCYLTYAYYAIGCIGDKTKSGAYLEIIRLLISSFLLNYQYPALLGSERNHNIMKYINLGSLLVSPLISYYLNNTATPSTQLSESSKSKQKKKKKTKSKSN